MKVLVIQLKMIGDVLASSIICEAIKSKNAEIEIHYLIQKGAFPVVENNPFIDKIVFFDSKKFKGFRGLNRFGKELQKENYDTIIDVYGKWETLIPAFVSKCPRRIGVYKSYTKFFFTETFQPKPQKNGTAIGLRMQFAEVFLKEDLEVFYPKIYLSSQEIDAAKLLIQEKLDTSKPIYIISVLGSEQIKSLPNLQMARFLDFITPKISGQLVLNYMPNQKNQAKEIYEACKDTTKSKIVFDFYTKGLREFLAVLSQSDALLGNEGGATNMAKALQIPTFTIFAPWINRNSWNIFEETGFHDVVHLIDFEPELYQGKHPKKFKNKALEWYLKLNPDFFKTKLENFVQKIELKFKSK